MFQGPAAGQPFSFPHHPGGSAAPGHSGGHGPNILLERQAAQALGQPDGRQAGRGRSCRSPAGAVAEQQAIWEDSLQRTGRGVHPAVCGGPGCSEHQTGLAIDLGRAAREIDFIRPDFPEEGACGRFRRLAPRYGFIQRYHREKESLTGIACEPWHYRYVGTPHALLMEREGLCLEEYLDWVQTAPRTCRLEHGRSARVFYMPCAGDETESPLAGGPCPGLRRQPERICRDSLGGVGMADGRRGAALDLFRLAAVVLVVANHTSPLVSVSPLGTSGSPGCWPGWRCRFS